MPIDSVVTQAPVPLIDAHLHLDHVRENAPERITWLQQIGCACVSWAFAQAIGSFADLRAYLDAQQSCAEDLKASGLQCYFLAGVHPRNIPPDLRPEDVRELVLPRLDHPLCRGIGEIGLETGSEREREIFAAHLALSPEVTARGKVFGVHTPRGDKTAMTAEVLGILRAYSGLRQCTVVDHCTPETAGEVLVEGYWAGMTLSPLKSSAQDVKAVLDRTPEARLRLLLNSDSGVQFHEDLYEFRRNASLPEDVRNELSCRNAARFLGLPAV